ncbi:MAG: TetR/AcrR family transcriptional regulator [Pseudomonadota bacterium]
MTQVPCETTRDLILVRAIPLFARNGYAAASMREIAQSVGISAAALYHHFPNKQSLYLEAMRHAFAKPEQTVIGPSRTKMTSVERLKQFVQQFSAMMSANNDLRTLLQREMLDGDEARLELLAKEVFHAQFQEFSEFAEELSPDFDPHLLCISLTGLVLNHFHTAPLRRFLPGGRVEHDDPSVIAEHVIKLVLNGVQQHTTTPEGILG